MQSVLIIYCFIILKLRSAGVSAKVCRLIREIFKNARGKVRLRTNEGVKYSDAFPIERGVLQGDIWSPHVFIVGPAAVFECFDKGAIEAVYLAMRWQNLWRYFRTARKRRLAMFYAS